MVSTMPTCCCDLTTFPTFEYVVNDTDYFVNAPPCSAKLVPIASNIVGAEDVCSRMDRQIDILANRLAVMREQRAGLSRFINIQKTVICPPPIRRVPVEVLAMIFCELCAAGATRNPRLKPKPAPVISNGPWHLRRVCRQWRAVVDRTPELWEKVRARIDSSLAGPLSQVIKRFTEGRNFAGSRNMHLTMALGPMLPRNSSANQILAAIFEACSRWKSIDLLLHPGSDAVPNCAGEEGNFSALESLTVSGYTVTPEWQVFLWSMFQAPRLSLLKLAASIAMWPLPSTYYDRLQTLHLSQTLLGVQDVLSILSMSPNLCTLNYSSTSAGEGSLDGANPVNMLHLRDVSVTTPEILMYLTLPALEAFSFTDSTVEQSSAPVVIDLISRSSCHLHTLTYQDVTTSDLIRLLELVPEVTDLSLGTTIWDVEADTVVAQLTGALRANCASSPFLPNLQMLEIVSRDEELDSTGEAPEMTFIDAAFVEMVKSRWLEGALMKVEVSQLYGQIVSVPQLDANGKDTIERLRHDGLVLTLRTIEL